MQISQLDLHFHPTAYQAFFSSGKKKKERTRPCESINKTQHTTRLSYGQVFHKRELAQLRTTPS